LFAVVTAVRFHSSHTIAISLLEIPLFSAALSFSTSPGRSAEGILNTTLIKLSEHAWNSAQHRLLLSQFLKVLRACTGDEVSAPPSWPNIR
jgi:hypothetical protein